MFKKSRIKLILKILWPLLPIILFPLIVIMVDFIMWSDYGYSETYETIKKISSPILIFYFLLIILYIPFAPILNFFDFTLIEKTGSGLATAGDIVPHLTAPGALIVGIFYSITIYIIFFILKALIRDIKERRHNNKSTTE
tara:strand:+ start:5902 stop:6321 length:420 start_codon:yes stop_codon:yes gene_type:complete